ncbi:cytochrome c oxidase subunit 1 [Geranomyces variabilis]|nr:cytochrome c oxidase subunit 1 [Geranomyces variabilis]
MADTVEDMTTLSELSEGAIMENLQKRYALRLIYTYTGSILVAMNPFEKLDIYNMPMLKHYIGKRHNENSPHIFAIAEAAYSNVRHNKVNQSVIISGESGAGKSESTKVILQYLTTVTSKEDQESWVEQQILEANTVLESFGNAKTVRNNNSSRFGKFIQVNFNRNSQIIGASIINYLLEKSRIATQAPDERNYHIFYELVAGVSDDERAKYQLEAAESYYFLSQSGCIDIQGVDDSKNFADLKLALTVLKMTPTDQDGLFFALSAVLAVGNIEFRDADGKDTVEVSNPETVDKVAGLMGIDAKILKQALCFKKLVIRGETSLVPYKLQQAKDTRDSFAKAVYDHLFQRLVEFINKSLTPKEKPQNFVGVLDIFGFEVFKHNSFEQFCINYTNEKLQSFFNQFIFKLEQEEYDKESIKWDKIEFSDNQMCLDLIEAKPAGILSLLDEETKFPKGTDESWLSKIDAAHAKQPFYVKARTQKGVFGIKHYAGDVTYSVASFLDKNRDAIQEELYEVVRASKIPYIAKIFPTVEKDDAKGGPRGGKTTAGTSFKNSLVSLVTTLGATTPHYVRCIKPNQAKEAFLFDEEMVLSQLRYSGMLDTIRIRKAGYSMRLPFEGFVRDFKCLVPAGTVVKKDEAKKISAAIAAESELPPNSWQCGKTKFFIKESAYAALQDRVALVLRAKVVLIQKTMLGFMYRKQFLRKRNAARLLETFILGFLCKRAYKRKLRATLKIQAVSRGWFARDYYRKLKAEQKAREKEATDRRMKAEAEAAAAGKVVDNEGALEITAPGVRRASIAIVSPPVSSLMPTPSREELGKALPIKPSQQIKDKKVAVATTAPAEATVDAFSAGADEPPTPTAAKKKQAGEIDNLFAFLGEFDASKRTGAFRGAEMLAEMAATITAEIDSLFDEPIAQAKAGLARKGPAVGPSAAINTSGSDAPVAQLQKQSAEQLVASTHSLDAQKGGQQRSSVDALQSQGPSGLMQQQQQQQAPQSAMSSPSGSRYNSAFSLSSDKGAAVSDAKLMKHNPIMKDSVTKRSNESIDKIDANSRELSLQAYAEKHFEQHYKASGFATIGKKRALMDMQEMLVWSKHPIQCSMTKIPNKTDALDQLAVDSFKSLQKAADPGTKKPEDLAQAFVGHGVEHPELRDELYVQLIKQLTPPKDGAPKHWEHMYLYMWYIITMACACFPPSKVFAKFLLAFLQRTSESLVTQDKNPVRKLAVAAEKAVRRLIMNGARRNPPSVFEFMTLKQNGVLPCRFSLLDGRELDIAVGLTTTAGDIVKDMARKIDLKDSTGWALYEMSTKSERAVKATEYIADFIAGWERDREAKKKETGTIKKKKGEVSMAAAAINLDANLVFKKRVFRDSHDPTEPIEPVEYGLLYAQAVDGVSRDLYPISEGVAMKMAALRAQVLLGDCDVNAAELRFVTELPVWIAPRLVPNQPREAWVQGIIKQYQKLAGTTPDGAKSQYLAAVQGFKHYGASLFPVKHKGSWNFSEGVSLAVSQHGIDFVHPRTNDTLLSFPYPAVKSYEHEQNLVTIVAVPPITEDAGFESTEVYQFFTEQAEEIISLVREYCPTTEYMRKVEKAPTTYDVDFGSLVRDVNKYRAALLDHSVVRRPGPDGGVKRKAGGIRRLFTTAARSKSGTATLTTNPSEGSFVTEGRRDSTASSRYSTTTDGRLEDYGMESPSRSQTMKKSPSNVGKPAETDEGAAADDYSLADWSFSMRQLTTSLIATMDPDVEKWAADTAAVIQTFMGTSGAMGAPVPEIATCDVGAFQGVIERCVNSVVLTNELYLQLVKHTTSHPNPDGAQVLNLWKLLAVVCGVVAPNGYVLEYAKAHLRKCSVVGGAEKHPGGGAAASGGGSTSPGASGAIGKSGKLPLRTEEAQHARHCLRMLRKTISTGARRCPPSMDEFLQAAKLTPMRIRFHLLDGSSHAAPIEPSDTSDVIFAALLDKMKVSHTRGSGKSNDSNNPLAGFAIFEQCGAVERALHRDEKIADSLFRHERTGRTERNPERVHFFLKRKLFLPAQLATPSSPTADALTRAQALVDVGKTMHPASDDDALRLTALQAQVANGDFNYDTPVNYAALCALYLPQRMRVDGVDKRVGEKHMEFLGMTPQQAGQEMNQIVRKWPLYGCTVFNVEQNIDKNMPAKCWLAVGASAVHILARQSPTPLFSYSYDDIVSFSPSHNSLLLIIGNNATGQKYMFTTVQASQVADLMRDYLTILRPPTMKPQGSMASRLDIRGSQMLRP